MQLKRAVVREIFAAMGSLKRLVASFTAAAFAAGCGYSYHLSHRRHFGQDIPNGMCKLAGVDLQVLAFPQDLLLHRKIVTAAQIPLIVLLYWAQAGALWPCSRVCSNTSRKETVGDLLSENCTTFPVWFLPLSCSLLVFLAPCAYLQRSSDICITIQFMNACDAHASAACLTSRSFRLAISSCSRRCCPWLL
jgi:hypothetical protein